MIEKKSDKLKNEQKPRDDGVDLENQFILRIPEDVANSLHEALSTGNLKDRMSIRLDNDLRYGEVCFDNHLLYGKIVDMPTIIECLKTIDNKNFYKSADVCQMMICKTEPEDESEKESPNKGKKKDPNKVDKKYLWPHGVTPPCKNVRKRRFRKTLKKKNVEAPEIEKEVKRLLRVDNEAVKVDYEIINEDIDKSNMDQVKEEYNEDYNESRMNDQDKTDHHQASSHKEINIESDDDDPRDMRERSTTRLGEHDIFGEEVSSSDDEDGDMKREADLDESSRISADDSHMGSYYMGGRTAGQHENLNDTQGSMEFGKYEFGSPKDQEDESMNKYEDSNMENLTLGGYDDDDSNYQSQQINVGEINSKINELRRQINEHKAQHAQKQQEISSIQNPTLRQRMQETLDNLLSQILEKELEIKDYEVMLENYTGN